MTRWAAAAGVVVALNVFAVAAVVDFSGVTCADFKTRAQAAEQLTAHPALDGDKDGIPCEALPNGR